MALHRRLLQDIAELQANPYPNIVLCVQDNDLQSACLLLTPLGKGPLHLTISFGPDYPLRAPRVSIESQINHPNVYNSYICASILNTTEGYTPGYTLKGIAIQLLSFFSSERIEQEGGRYSVDLAEYGQERRRYPSYGSGVATELAYRCAQCGFGGAKFDEELVIVGQKVLPNPFAKRRDVHPQSSDAENSLRLGCVLGTNDQDSMEIDGVDQQTPEQRSRLLERILAVPDELLMLILDELDTRDLLAAAKVCSKIGEFMNSYDCIRMRELQCFCLKESFLNAKLGVGVHIARRGRLGTFESEFDLLSQEAFNKFHVRRSIQGLGFEYWLPLPISRRHWRSLRADIDTSLEQLARAAAISEGSDPRTKVIYSFMNDVVVKFSREAESQWGDGPKSTLTHASEKAVESYFGLFHLLLCLATEKPLIVRDANRLLLRFKQGHTSKTACPSLGQLLVAVLISNQGLTEELAMAIIKEAILRNVVWMLDCKGAGMAELSYIEPSAVSDYRLQRTFEASKISYRLLMFLALFYRTARIPGKSIADLRDDMFDMHSAPPHGTAETMAQKIRQIRTVNSFPDFFKAMGLTSKTIPEKAQFCAFLKRTVEESVKVGYSCQPITQAKALAIRMVRDPGVEVKEGIPSDAAPPKQGISFFPSKGGKGRR